MENVKAVAKKLGVIPKLRLGIKLAKGGAKSTGPHRVKFLEEPTLIEGMDDQGKPRQEFRFVVEENGEKYHWNVPLKGKDGNPNYLLEKLMYLDVGNIMILEMMSNRGRNYIDVRKVGETSSSESVD